MKRIIGSVLALSLLASGGAFAAGQNSHDRDHDRPQDRNDHRDDRGPQQARHDDHRDDRRDDRHDDRHDNGRHEGWRHHQRGERLALGHRGDRVPDYRKHGLRAPPRGHEWRRVDDQYVLIAVATGIIASVVANSR
ncbi:RcnB family protein [Xanthomonas sp. AM6]|uniref:RcnB family protein n=1 Tax=Xanthomonas sp. AM6 TaxID=2982531 RepID=UPI0021D9ED4E|nr:RcnB family protein [Xanthomonas sp. AM6]UYB53794.1 RcnB family protein [Xanthomonas sp. AM6]